jgi:hydroxymethylglutaryl-CoA reductase
MRLHARQVAVAAGAKDGEVAQVVKRMTDEDVIRPDKAAAVLAEIRDRDATRHVVKVR